MVVRIIRCPVVKVVDGGVVNAISETVTDAAFHKGNVAVFVQVVAKTAYRCPILRVSVNQHIEAWVGGSYRTEHGFSSSVLFVIPHIAPNKICIAALAVVPFHDKSRFVISIADPILDLAEVNVRINNGWFGLHTCPRLLARDALHAQLLCERCHADYQRKHQKVNFPFHKLYFLLNIRLSKNIILLSLRMPTDLPLRLVQRLCGGLAPAQSRWKSRLSSRNTGSRRCRRG